MLIPETIQLGVSNFESPFRFWLMQAHENYVLMELYAKESRTLNFPSIPKKELEHNVFVKTSNILRNGDIVYFHDPKYCREYEEITAPLYHISEKDSDIFIYDGEEKTRTCPNKKTLEMAIKYFENVVKKEIARVRFENEFNANTKDGISSFITCFPKEDLDRIEGEYSIICDLACCNNENNYKFSGIIIDKTKVPTNKSSVTIKVLNPFFDKAIGYDKKNIKRVEKEIGKHIKVKK